jgi:hypothetical protein
MPPPLEYGNNFKQREEFETRVALSGQKVCHLCLSILAASSEFVFKLHDSHQTVR